MTTEQLQRLWYIIAICVGSITILKVTSMVILLKIKKKRAAKNYSIQDKIDYYTKRANNPKLSYSKRKHAIKKSKNLSQ